MINLNSIILSDLYNNLPDINNPLFLIHVKIIYRKDNLNLGTNACQSHKGIV